MSQPKACKSNSKYCKTALDSKFYCVPEPLTRLSSSIPADISPVLIEKVDFDSLNVSSIEQGSK